MSGIKDVAAVAGVSTATVSRVLNDSTRVSDTTRATVLAAARQLEFVPSYSAASLASGRHRNIAVIVPSVSRWYFSQVIDAIAASLLEAGYDLTLYNLSDGTGHRDRVLSEFIFRQRCDGVITVALELQEHELAQLLAVRKPVVGIGGPLDGAVTIGVDDREIATLATEHLISLGHRRIAMLGGSEECGNDFRVAAQRRRGYEEAMSAAGLETHASWHAAADFTIPGGLAAGRKLLGYPRARPTAVFCASDEMAIGLILAARELGLRIPEELSVIGIDGHDLGESFGLTTVAQFPGAQSRLAVDRLLALLGEPEPERIEDPHQLAATALTIRHSTAAVQTAP